MLSSWESAFILDNGGYTIKAGHWTATEPRLFPNCITKSKNERFRVFISDQIEELKERYTLFYQLPFQKGMLLKYDVQRQIWDYLFSESCMKVNTAESCLIITEPHFNISRELFWEVLFEDYAFHCVYCSPATALSMYKYVYDNRTQPGCVVIDSGYSCTYVVPYYEGKMVEQGVVRLDVGGKMMTNRLKEIVSYRQVNVLNETYIMNECKEDVCYVSENFAADMRESQKPKAKNSIMRQYLLPDYISRYRGQVCGKDDPPLSSTDQYVTLNNERFSVPELLFHPSMVGMNEMGLAEIVAHSILEKCPRQMAPILLNNIILTGGNCLLKGIQKRLWTELRPMIPEEYNIRIKLAEDPIGNAWRGGRLLAESSDLSKIVVTKAMYDDEGADVCRKYFVT
ncbi:hypothetical protein M514_03228 [Trichuris suis]|uniref:Actin n=1 Tax=Trichuris suis TaxID=68888 RepID=A0A085MX18_9BILA|nr:hypothetical protein M513_03228 [Trichuris suis]KFD61764.1 hypothetical protein M514_03228 [Trichuris suis]